MDTEPGPPKDLQKPPIEIYSPDGEIVLRQFTLGDSEEIFQLIDRNRGHLSQFGDDTAQKYPTLESVRGSIERPKNPKRLRFGIRNKEGILAGSINLTPDEDNPERAEIGYYLVAEFQGKGYVTRAVETLTDYGFDHLGYKAIYGVVNKDNIRFARVLRDTGYRISDQTKFGEILHGGDGKIQYLRKSDDRERYFWPFGQDTITASHADAGLEEYEHEFCFSREELKGKTILDLGSGTTDKFAREVKQAGIDAKVVSLSPDLHTSYGARSSREKVAPDWKIRGVAAIAQQLPFKDNSFDMILGAYSVTYYATTEKDVNAYVREIKRVLKKGGEARLVPVYDNGSGRESELIKKAAEAVNLSFLIPVDKESAYNHQYYLLLKT